MKLFLKIKTWLAYQLENLSFRQKVFVAIMSLALPLIAYGYWYLYPQYLKIESLKKELIQLKKEISKYKKMTAQKVLLEKKLKEREKFLKRLVVTLPSEKEIPELLSSVSDKAEKSGLEVISFTPKGEVAKNYYKIIPFVMEVRGSFEELVFFLDQVSILPRIIAFNTLDISLKESKGTTYLSSKCIFHTYRYTGKTSSGKKK